MTLNAPFVTTFVPVGVPPTPAPGASVHENVPVAPVAVNVVSVTVALPPTSPDPPEPQCNTDAALFCERLQLPTDKKPSE